MKSTLNFSTEHLNSCLKRQPSMKSTTLLKMGLTVNSFHADTKTRRNHCRTKTDQFIPQTTASTASAYIQSRLKCSDRDKKQNKKANIQIELKKARSFKQLDGNQTKNSSVYRSHVSKDSRHDTQTIKSIQKLRKDLNKTNPQIAAQQFKLIINNDKKNGTPNTLTNQCFMLSTQLLDTIKTMQKKHSNEMADQKQSFERREQKLIKKIIEMEKKNQRCSVLINQMRMRNIDVDSIWHEQKINSKIDNLME